MQESRVVRQPTDSMRDWLACCVGAKSICITIFKNCLSPAREASCNNRAFLVWWSGRTLCSKIQCMHSVREGVCMFALF